MTKQRREEAIEYIEGQLENGYVDLSPFDGGADAFEIVKEAINALKLIYEWNSIGCTSFRVTAEELKELLERQKKKEVIGFDQRIKTDFCSSEFGKPFKIILRGDLKYE